MYNHEIDPFVENSRSTKIRNIPITIIRSSQLTNTEFPIPVQIVKNTQKTISSNVKEDCKFLPPISLDKYKLNIDPDPEVIHKKPLDKVRYTQDVSVRYLEPPSLPKPGDIIIRQLPNRQIAPAPPLVVRQTPPTPITPAPLVIRELPPTPPPKISEQLILIPGKVLPPPARKVVIERLPPIPPKPQQIFLEKWLPFKKQKRRVIYEKAEPDCVLPNPRNLIIQWDPPQVEINRRYKNLGVFKVDPVEYLNRHRSDLINHNEFISKARNIGIPSNLIEKDSHQDLGEPELEGDIEALNLIDLDRVGLSNYRDLLNNFGIRVVDNSPGEFGFVRENSKLISIDQVENIVDDLNSGSEKLISDVELRNYFNSINDDNDDDDFNYEEFEVEY
ncbi:unnamed protein product [Brachionus calyciflorus]|uniref:Uncharacterized protein n=1 Tax=Brachionus calyciflorus TaxID=104777 RepID=A0A813QFU6_9BILA|nr:unnamed protein product [Brachionus calyciflorus]